MSADAIGSAVSAGMTPSFTAGMGGEALQGVGAAQSPFSAFLTKAQPFLKGMGNAQKVMGSQPQPQPMPMDRPPSMNQPQNQQTSAQILAGQGPSAQIAGALPPGAQPQLTPAQLALLLKLRGYA